MRIGAVSYRALKNGWQNGPGGRRRRSGTMLREGRRARVKPGTRVLVVEDDRPIARLLELEFEHNGLAVRCAYDGASGLEAAEQFAPSVIVLDIMLPVIDGVCVLKRLRQRGERAAVLMLTAR